MKVRHFNTAFRASLLLLVALCSSVALSDGTCYLTQYSTGEYVIRCEGDGIWINYVDHTNEVYIIENCETLKANLLYAVDSLSNDLYRVLYSDDPYYGSVPVTRAWVSGISTYVQSSENISPSDAQTINTYVDGALANLDNLAQNVYSVYDSLSISENSLYSQINGIVCGSCSTNSVGGSCCDVDLTPILSRMNEVQFIITSVTNALGFYVGGNTNNKYWRFNVNLANHKETISLNNQLVSVDDKQRNNLINVLNLIHSNLSATQASINNYLHKISFEQLPNISNNLEIVMSTTTNFYNSATNHFSLFRKITFQDSPLVDYSQQSTFDSYYDFLTNHYVKVSFKQYNSLVGEEKGKTNWFSRIETLLAALVFNDSEGTNTVDDTYGQSQQDNLINSLDGMNQTSITQVNLMSNMGDSLLASLRSLNSSFSSAVSMPGEVNLAEIHHSNGMVTQYIKFQSSEISQLVEACRCATTLAWCFGGIWLLFLFVSWSIKTSYSLCVFCWSVVSAIFGGGKT